MYRVSMLDESFTKGDFIVNHSPRMYIFNIKFFEKENVNHGIKNSFICFELS